LKTHEQVAVLLTQHVVAGWAGFCDLFVEGVGEPDLTTRTTPYATLEIVFARIEQVALMGRRPPKRSRGTVELTFGWPATYGAKYRSQFADKVENLLTCRAVDEIELGDGNILSVVEGNDWKSQTAIVDFNFELTT
jgi:hypothetical protein